MPGFKQHRRSSFEDGSGAGPTNARKGLQLTMVKSPPLKLADEIRMG